MSSQQTALQEHRGHSTHQNEAHKILRDAGYSFVRETAHNANLYRNEHGDLIKSVCSPRSNGRALNQIRTEIRRNERAHAQEEAHVNAETTKASAADQLIAMANEFLTKELGPDDHPKTPAYRAKYAAYAQWMRRCLERFPGTTANDLDAATKRLGFSTSWYHRARKELGVAAVHGGGDPDASGKWKLYLSHDVPAGRKGREDRRPLLGNPPPGVEVMRREDVQIPEPSELPILRVAEAAANGNGNGNGKHLTEQQTAALMLLESLGIKSPGDEAREALLQAAQALTAARESVDKALLALA